MDDRYPEFGKTPFELAHGFFIFQLILDALLGRGFIGRVLVQINALGNAVEPDIPIEAVHGRQGPLVVLKKAIYRSRRIIAIAHENALIASVFEPGMMGAIQLDHFTEMMLSRPPLSVLSPFALLINDVFPVKP